ncbi:unnamed protein product [Clonostachys solani]|uniref:Alpha/beta hydrolase fold-3 domain-containing protein n=1 Tax=Clonostachys solani TaxID=160281 RepID=A0A9N9YTS1_9HYPO|nr:unnamed protein product [Clonostachys solani]
MANFDSVEGLTELGKTHPELEKHLATAELSPVVTLPFEQVVQLFKANPQPVPRTWDLEYTAQALMRDGYQNEYRVHRPDDSSVTPLVVLVHGGGFVIGHNSHISVYSRAIAKLYGVTVVNVSYRLAPEHPFPAAPNDVWDALKWLTRPEAANELKLDTSLGLYIGGVSAGANLAAVTAQRWVTDQVSPKLNGVWLGIPYVLEADLVPSKYKHLWFSREQNAEAMIINKKAIEFCTKSYAHDLSSPLWSPFAAANPHTGMPPVYFQVAGQDPLRDDGLIYEKVLRENKVSTRLDVYPGVPHGFAEVFPELEIARKASIDTLAGFGWLMGREAEEAALEKAWDDSVAVQKSD